MMMGGGGLNESSMGGAGRKYHFISEILRLRAHSTSDHLLFTLLNSKGTETQTLTCSQLHKKAERIARLLIEKVIIELGCLTYCNIIQLFLSKKVSNKFKNIFQDRLNTGDHVALIYPPGVELIAAFYGCLYVGVVPVTIRPPHPQVRSETKYKRICSAS